MSNISINTARHFLIRSPGKGEVVKTHLAPRKDNEVLVRALFSGISRGTETLVFRGEVPPAEYQSMRAPFQEGEFPGPLKYGYISVGKIEEGPDPLPKHLINRTVFCLYPHQDFYCVPVSSVTAVPPDVPASRAVLAANMETALNVLWDAQPVVGDRIVIIGAGVVGLLIAWLCRQIPATKVSIVDINPSRESVATDLGIQFLVDSPHDANADIVIHASGKPDGLRSALDVAGMEATIVDVSWYGNRLVSLPLGEAFHSRRLTIRSSQVGRIRPDRALRWNRNQRIKLALDFLREPKLDILISGESRFEELPEVLASLSSDSDGTLCHRIKYSTSSRDEII